jgi:YVTN family beta-propeller protein
MLYIENTYGHSITVVDTEDFKVVNTIELDPECHPDDVACNSDGSILYCNMSTDGGHPLALARGDKSIVVAIDTKTLKEIWRIEIKGHCGHMAIASDDRYLYSTLFDRWFVARIDLATQEVVYIPVTFNGGHGIRITEDNKRLYVGSILMSKIDKVNLETLKVEQTFLFRENVRPFHFTRDEQRLYVQLSWTHGFAVVDIPNNRHLKTIALPTLPPETPVIDSFPHTVDHGLEITPDEKHVVLLASTGNHAAICSLPDLNLVKTIPLGGVPNWITIDKTGTYAYASNRITDDVSVIDLKEFKEIERVKVGRFPQRMWVTN